MNAPEPETAEERLVIGCSGITGPAAEKAAAEAERLKRVAGLEPDAHG